MNLSRVDLNLLVAFEALMSERNVTAAAQRLGIGQSAMSSTLGRIRDLFHDPILVRQGRSMVPTPLASALAESVRAALAELQLAFSRLDTFDPETDERTFAVMASDYAAAALLHPLLAETTTHTPNIHVQIRNFPPDMSAPLLLGQVDVLILPREIVTSYPALWGEDVHREALYRDRYVVAADADNPAVSPMMTIEEFSSMPYLAATFGNGARSPGESNLNVLGIPRSVEVGTTFAVAPFMLRGTDLVMLLPQLFGAHFARAANLQLVDPPVPLQPITQMMLWLRRLDEDPAHIWFRDQLRRHARRLVATRT